MWLQAVVRNRKTGEEIEVSVQAADPDDAFCEALGSSDIPEDWDNDDLEVIDAY